MGKEIYNTLLDTFENEDIKQFAIKCIEVAPEYFWHVPASSTGKYHPQYSLGESGLARHTIALVRILNHMFEVESVANQFTSRERDLLRVAGITHDMMKSGTQEDYEKSKYTKFDHPILAAKMVWGIPGEISDVEKTRICRCIMSHMGAWNCDKRYPNIILPKPEDKYQIILHLCDYLASRKDIEILFDDQKSEHQPPKPSEPADINTWRLPFGKFKGLTLLEVKKQAPWYIKWAKENATSEPLKTLAQQL